MKRSIAVFMLFAGFAPLLTAETNALVEVVLFKNWGTSGKSVGDS